MCLPGVEFGYQQQSALVQPFHKDRGCAYTPHPHCLGSPGESGSWEPEEHCELRRTVCRELLS